MEALLLRVMSMDGMLKPHFAKVNAENNFQVIDLFRKVSAQV